MRCRRVAMAIAIFSLLPLSTLASDAGVDIEPCLPSQEELDEITLLQVASAMEIGHLRSQQAQKAHAEPSVQSSGAVHSARADEVRKIQAAQAAAERAVEKADSDEKKAGEEITARQVAANEAAQQAFAELVAAEKAEKELAVKREKDFQASLVNGSAQKIAKGPSSIPDRLGGVSRRVGSIFHKWLPGLAGFDLNINFAGSDASDEVPG